MIEPLGRLKPLVIATGIIWLSLVVVWIINIGAVALTAAAILALLATVTIWSMWALDAYGISVDGTPPQEKAKRDTGEDARIELLLALLTPDEREALRARIVDDLNADGEAVSLADLLADQEADDMRSERAS